MASKPRDYDILPCICGSPLTCCCTATAFIHGTEMVWARRYYLDGLAKPARESRSKAAVRPVSTKCHRCRGAGEICFTCLRGLNECICKEDPLTYPVHGMCPACKGSGIEGEPNVL